MAKTELPILTNEKFLRTLIKAGKIDKNTATATLANKAQSFDKETILDLIKIAGLPENDLLALHVVALAKSDELLTEVLRRSRPCHHHFLALAKNIMNEHWLSPDNVSAIWGIRGSHVPHTDQEKIDFINIQTYRKADHLVALGIALSGNDSVNFFEKLDLLVFILNEVQKTDVYKVHFYQAIDSWIVKANENKEIYVTHQMAIAFLRFGTRHANLIVVRSEFWKKLNQKDREVVAKEAGIRWCHFAFVNNGLGTIKWKDIPVKDRYEWTERIYKEEEKLSPPGEIDGHMLWLSWFNYEIDALSRKKSFTEKTLAPLMVFIHTFGIETVTYFMGTWDDTKDLFQSMPYKKQLEFIRCEALPKKAADEFVKHCLLPFKEWKKLRMKMKFFIPDEVIIKNTKWENESPNAIREASILLAPYN